MDRVCRELIVTASPEAVWAAVTGDGWLAEEVVLELWPGGEARFRDPEETKTGWVEDVRAPEDLPGATARLAFWWATDSEAATRVELAIAAEGERATRLTVVESRPLDALDLVGTPLPGPGGRTFGPALVAG